MTKTAHTPAPWRYEASTMTVRSVPGNHWLASLNSWDRAVNHDANGPMLAAAAAMYDALTNLLAADDAITRAEAHAALAAARGEG